MNDVPGCYTLLADDNCHFANDPKLLRSFKAHLVYNLVLNGRIAFSDNQVICSSNLQTLAASDATVIALFEKGFFDLAIRSDFDETSGPASLQVVHQAFLKERKIRHAARRYDANGALGRIARCSRPLPWSYSAVRQNYTDRCEQLLLREFRPLLSDTGFENLTEILVSEKMRDSGLGRVFLQERLHRRMRSAGIRVGEARNALIMRCTEAPYLSNLPATIGLNPIYGDEHRASFELLRGGDQPLATTGEENVPSRFDHEHYVEGLCRLNLDDIRWLQEAPARRVYLSLTAAGIAGEQAYEDAFRAFVEFNRLIEDRIASRFPEIARHSPGDPGRKFLKQHARRYAAAGADDLLGIAVAAVSSVVPLALCKQVLFDVVGPLTGVPPPTLPTDEVEREVLRRRLGEHLRRAGRAERIQVEDQPVAGAPFVKEIIIS